jgi:hypothetical protein
MGTFYKLKDFERRFEIMDVTELKRWKEYWIQHAEGLAPKIKKLAMKRVHEIEKAIQQRSKEQ